MIGYARKFDENTTMSLRVNKKKLLKNYNKICEKVERLMKINFESKPVYGDDEKYIKTEIKIYAGSLITNFHNRKVPKEKASYKWLSIIMLDSVVKANKRYYTQKFLEECKYVEQKNNYIDEELKSDSGYNDDDDETKSDIDNDE